MTTPGGAAKAAGPRVDGTLSQILITLAGTPDDLPLIDALLDAIVRCAAETLPGVSYASVTARRDGAPTTVAMSSSLALAVDRAQYDEDTGPCLDALHTGEPVSVPRMATTMQWPGFRAAALRMGLRASLSIPLFAGSGATVAALNLYGHDGDAITGLGIQVLAAYDPGDDVPGAADAESGPAGDAAAADLITGLTEAFAVRAHIQQAIGMVVAERRCSREDAYVTLRLEAATTGTPLAAAAVAVLERAA
jgi:hypothetical protein